jgi:hypothetical protein
MTQDKTRMDEILEEARRNRAQKEKSYRGQALKLFPWVCARCGREFEGKRVRELTVHHKDHNHDNNPPDGSNWELLCLYCHDNEHARNEVADAYDRSLPGESEKHGRGLTHKPFAGLGDLLTKLKADGGK